MATTSRRHSFVSTGEFAPADIMRDQLKRKDLLEQAKQYAFEYIDQIESRSVYPTKEALDNLAVFDEPIPTSMHQGGEHNATDILKLLHTYGSPATTASTGGRYFGFVNGNSIPTATAAGWIAQVWDQNTALHVMSPIAAKLEQVCEQWVVDLLGLDTRRTAMGLVGGTSVANMCALAAARHFILQQQFGWDVNQKGLFGAPKFRVIVGDQAHGSVGKALALLGLGSERIERVPSDAQGRMIPEELPELDGRCLVILQAGHVSTGAFDDIHAVCNKSNGAWVHVDGAFGLWAAASSSLKHLTHGIEVADSWAVDGHKTLNTPYDCGIVLCKHRAALNAAMNATGSYLQHESGNRDGMFFTPDMSRRARSIELWATLKYLGREGVEKMVDAMVLRAKEFGEQLGNAGFHVQNDIVFNQCLFKCDSPEETVATLAHVQRSGTMWCGGATWENEPAIRISVCSWSTTEMDVIRSVQTLVESRDRLRISAKDQKQSDLVGSL